MARPSRYGSLSLIGIFLVFLSLFNITVSSPLPDGESLVERAPKTITKERYEEYLQRYFPQTDKYLLYSGNSKDTQVVSFVKKNPDYLYYSRMIDAPEGDNNHEWYQFFDANEDMDDAEAASRAIAAKVSGDVKVFGAIEWREKGSRSFFTNDEIPELRKGLADGRIKSINHMVKDTTDPTKILATDDLKKEGKPTYKQGHSEDEKNASGPYGVCTTALGLRLGRRAECDAPTLKPKKPKPQSVPEPPKGDPKSLKIILEEITCEAPSCDARLWRFLEGEPGEAADPCGKSVRKDVILDGSNGDAFPDGEWPMRFAGYAKDCVYKGHGEIRAGGDGEVGWLNCPDRDAIKCVVAGAKSGDMKRCDLGVEAKEVAYCDWDF
ncbi:hypothetical protein M011DRAFT_514678 [Sporormia fimetaria CBS 119925]|uniref:Uncharacterized protein n=1 Tax=Sporormia fimetaria CBS 119925 TaxID=1340428 RepID=A0A6A6VF04_9PLEO|nr:hypothetical protein M011DRAFT_514678 [Sporormia fimetaria CBS 119925]